jgi:hypothetical protein
MDAKANFNKFVKDISESAREFASYSLSYGSKALDFSAQKLKEAEARLKERAEKWAPKKGEATSTEEKNTPAE